MKRKHPSAITHDLQPAATQATATSFTPVTPQLKTGDSQTQTAGPAVYRVNHSIQPFAAQRLSAYYETEKTSERTPFIQREPKGKAKQTPLETCMQAPDVILPAIPGKSAAEQGMMLKAMLGIEAPAMIAAIRNNPAARHFVCEHGLGGIAALVDTSQGTTFDLPAASKALKEDPSAYDQEALAGWRVAVTRQAPLVESANRLGDWANRQDNDRKDVPNMAAALNMDKPQLADIDIMIASIQPLQVHASGVKPLMAPIGEQLAAIKAIYTRLAHMSTSASYGQTAKELLRAADEKLQSLHKPLAVLSQGRADLREMHALINLIIEQNAAIRQEAHESGRSKSPFFDGVQGMIDTVETGALKELLEQYKTRTELFSSLADHAESLLFALRYFKALNDPSATPPTEAELNKYHAILEDLETQPFFQDGKGKSLMKEVVKFVHRQATMRLQMKSQTNKLPGAVPTLAEAKAYFTSLKRKGASNDAVRQAYTSFAQAWFQHRGATSLADLQVDATADLFDMPSSITGTRTIVCSGYAQMGASLMELAGATQVTFINGVRATTEDILADDIAEGHTAVEIVRHGEIFYISNENTIDRKVEVMWPLANYREIPLHEEEGPTQKASMDKLLKKLMRIGRTAARKQQRRARK